MLNLRSIRLRNVIGRNVITKCRRSKVALCSTLTSTTSTLEPGRSDESETVSSDPVLRKKWRFEALPEEGELKFKIPGLSVREETFIKQQTRIILRPDCMREISEIQGIDFLLKFSCKFNLV